MVNFLNKIKSKPKLWLSIGVALALLLILVIILIPSGRPEENSPPTESATEAETKLPETTEGETEATEEIATSMEETEIVETEPESMVEQTEISVPETTEALTEETTEVHTEQITPSTAPVYTEPAPTEPTPTEPTPTEPTPTEPAPTEPVILEPVDTSPVTSEQFARFSGQFVEDGSDELVENVAAMLVTNHSGQFIDLCTLEYEIDGKTAIFVITGLPSGRSAWIMESSRMVVSDDAEFRYVDNVSALKNGVISSTDKITITSDGNMLTAVNNTSEKLEEVYIYYKTLHTDGNFLGGITYLVDFGDLESGIPVEKLAGHYAEETTEIVRIGWKDS